jgi:SAM-dependent methyltransferase
MANNARELLRQTFDEDAELYDRARPGYPEQLFDDVCALAHLRSGAGVLEIGCGTGHATLPLARRGCAVVAVELGRHLAALARRKLAPYPRVEVVTAPFETWEPPRAAFDAVFAASSWHWLDPTVRYGKAAALLKPGAALAIVQATRADEEASDPFFKHIRELYRQARAATAPPPSSRGRALADLSAEIAQTGLFARVQTRRYVWSVEYTADEYVELLNTHSGDRVLQPAYRAALHAEVRRLIDARPNGRVRKFHAKLLHVAANQIGGTGSLGNAEGLNAGT